MNSLYYVVAYLAVGAGIAAWRVYAAPPMAQRDPFTWRDWAWMMALWPVWVVLSIWMWIYTAGGGSGR